ncbi:MAG: nucleoid-associated protein [Sphingomonadaceae bacterium]
MNEIVALVIHDLERESDGFHVRLGHVLANITATTRRVVDELHDLYNRRPSRAHGRFSAGNNNATPEQLRRYLTAQRPDFLGLTASMMLTLQRHAGKKAGAAGGHVLFAHLRQQGRDYVLVAIVNDRLGAMLSGDKELLDVRHLDLDGFRFAGRINLTAWQAGEDRYVGFLRGRGQVSEYFKAFLGVDAIVQARRDTVDLVNALVEFTRIQHLTGGDSHDFLKRARTICARAAKANEELEFAALANELMPRAPEILLHHIAHADRRLNDHFIPDARALRPLVQYQGKTDDWTLEFGREALTRGVVRFDPRRNTLTLRNLPRDLLAQLHAEVADNG